MSIIQQIGPHAKTEDGYDGRMITPRPRTLPFIALMALMVLAAIKASLREDGRLVVVDRNTKGHAKFTMEEFKTQVDKAGFKLVEEHAKMTSKHFLMVFRQKQ